MLHLRVSDDVRPLAAALGEVLSEPPDDPMRPDWIAVPTEGMHRWLQLELARTLGAGSPGAGDGVAANVRFAFPGRLRELVLDATGPDDVAGPGEAPGDPWHVRHLVWAVLEALADARRTRPDDRLARVLELPEGATWYGRARRIADLYDRYALHRPELVDRWRAGHDEDPLGRPLRPGDAWQPHLWRLVRARIDRPSPPERLPGLVAALRAGTLAVDLPERIAVFGVTTIPGGPGFLELLDALAVHRDVHAFLLDPSPAASHRVGAAAPPPSGPHPRPRTDDRSARDVAHPLLRSWGRPYRERTLLLRRAGADGIGRAERPGTPAAAAPHPRATLLARLQRDLREDRAPVPDATVARDDRSVQVHSCHGPTRQVEVLRDVILHLLAADATLREEDIVVLCPDLATFAPLVEAGFGPSATTPPAAGSSGAAAAGGPPRLAYRIVDRSVRDAVPALAALDALLAIVGGRATATEVLEFLTREPVRRRFDLDDDALATIARWVAGTAVRWGLDGEHRTRWGLPPDFEANSWRFALDRLLVGAIVRDDDPALTVGVVAPHGVESGELEILGRLADVVERIGALAEDWARPRTPRAWREALATASRQFLTGAPDDEWQLERVHRVVATFADDAFVGTRATTAEISLTEVRRLLAEQLDGAPRRPAYFRGGVSVSSLTPLRWIPFRVVCVLGLDETGNAGMFEGDDLAALAPRIGDRDPAADRRQQLLEAVLAAGDHLVITRSGRNVRTNEIEPPSVVFAELRSSIVATLAGAERTWAERVEVVHPHQAFDERCFRSGALVPSATWSFDPVARDGARARRARPDAVTPFLADPLPAVGDDDGVVTLAELARFLDGPVRHFLRHRLLLVIPEPEDRLGDDLATQIGGLEAWQVARRLVVARERATNPARWRRHELRTGILPPGALGSDALDRIERAVDELFAAASELGIVADHRERHDVEVTLDDGTRVLGSVDGRGSADHPGPARITYSKAKPTQHLAAWLELVALVAHDPDTAWRSVVVRRRASGSGTDVLALVPRSTDPTERRHDARSALAVVVDLYRRALREPLPLFPSLSPALWRGTATDADWFTHDGRGDGDDPAHVLAFGGVDLEALLSIPVVAHDPDGPGTGRAERYAGHLWGTVDRTVAGDDRAS